jgi:c-di-GMP-binding flagellar brake protein YcgR
MRQDRERRAHPRLDAKEQVTIKVLEADGAAALVGREMTCSTQDLSVGGLRFRSETPIPVGGLLKLAIEAHQPKCRFEMQGRVVWMVPDAEKDRHAMGVHFTDVGRHALNDWRHMLENRGLLGA